MGVSLSFVSPIATLRSVSLVRSQSSWDRPGRRAKESCNESPSRGQRRENGQKVRHHSLYRLNASMIKEKKKVVHR
jgi:hypothetical protein